MMDDELRTINYCTCKSTINECFGHKSVDKKTWFNNKAKKNTHTFPTKSRNVVCIEYVPNIFSYKLSHILSLATK